MMRRFLLSTAAVVALLACGDGVGPAEAPSGAGRIAFQMRRNLVWDVYTVAADGSDLRNLTRSLEDDLSPAWSRDSRSLAFVSARAPEGIYIVNADGGDRRLLHAGAFIDHLTWAPDASRLAFGSGNAGAEIYLINVAAVLRWRTLLDSWRSRRVAARARREPCRETGLVCRDDDP